MHWALQSGRRWRSVVDGRTLTIIEVGVESHGQYFVRFDDARVMLMLDRDELMNGYEPVADGHGTSPLQDEDLTRPGQD